MTTHPDALIRQAFGQVERHRLVGDIIKRFSNNRSDVYELALQGLDFKGPVRVLDIGCGYGRFTGHLKDHIPAGSRCTGLDLLRENRQPFLDTARSIDLEADFITGAAEQVERMQNNSYELIITAYSLYFFSAVIPHLARILTPDGYLLIINHSRHFLYELMEDMNLSLSQSTDAATVRFDHEHLIGNFNDDNALDLLAPHFGTIDHTDYRNELSFPLDELEQCFVYIDFKLSLLIPEKQGAADTDLTGFRDRLFRRIRHSAEESGFYRFNKDDCIFRCSHPLKEDVPHAG